MSTVTMYVQLMFENTSCVQCGGGKLRIAHSRKWDPRTGDFTPGASKIRTIDISIVTARVHLLFENTSCVGCGGGAPCIVYLQNWALEKCSTKLLVAI